ncbi:unnamed protein product [Blepharisma stoltei]|uniref:Uncharacterized protein n=1 Tax=Blepharisma stoltei TaxID=1481888 RepID=A0AAU9J2V1_9CILI|nr:unnamed protein product [Blepharisma stoltei]
MGSSIGNKFCGSCGERQQTFEFFDDKGDNDTIFQEKAFKELSLLEILKGKDYSSRITTCENDKSNIEDRSNLRQSFFTQKDTTFDTWFEIMPSENCHGRRYLNKYEKSIDKSDSRKADKSTQCISRKRHFHQRSLSSNINESSVNLIDEIKHRKDIYRKRHK